MKLFLLLLYIGNNNNTNEKQQPLLLSDTDTTSSSNIYTSPSSLPTLHTSLTEFLTHCSSTYTWSRDDEIKISYIFSNFHNLTHLKHISMYEYIQLKKQIKNEKIYDQLSHELFDTVLHDEHHQENEDTQNMSSTDINLYEKEKLSIVGIIYFTTTHSHTHIHILIHFFFFFCVCL